MKIEDFLKEYVEGYLLTDLENMVNFQSCGSKYGGLSYPIALCTLAGMELLGGLLSKSKFDKNGNSQSQYFDDYWKNCLVKKNPKYNQYDSKLIRNLIRHGIAHTFFVKPSIWIVNNEPSYHLGFYEDDKNPANKIIYIDVIELYKDLKNSYFCHFKPQISSSGQDMQKRLNEMIIEYENDSNRFINNISTLQPNRVDFSTIPPEASGVPTKP